MNGEYYSSFKEVCKNSDDKLISCDKSFLVCRLDKFYHEHPEIIKEYSKKLFNKIDKDLMVLKKDDTWDINLTVGELKFLAKYVPGIKESLILTYKLTEDDINKIKIQKRKVIRESISNKSKLFKDIANAMEKHCLIKYSSKAQIDLFRDIFHVIKKYNYVDK